MIVSMLLAFGCAPSAPDATEAPPVDLAPSVQLVYSGRLEGEPEPCG